LNRTGRAGSFLVVDLSHLFTFLAAIPRYA